MVSSMSTRDEWIISQAAPTLEELEDTSSKCHLDDALTLCNYLNGGINAESAARLITAMVRRKVLDKPQDVPMALFQIMRLLAETLIQFDQDREMILDLLVAIQNLPSDGRVLWWRLPAFAELWQGCYVSHGDKDYKAPFFKKAGTLEAHMYMRGLHPVDDHWAYLAINLICLEGEGLELVIYEIHAWLDVAGSKLAENLQPAQVKGFERAVRGRREKIYDIQATMYEHWEHWKKRFLQVSYDEDFLSPEFRLMAGKCHEIMKSLVVNQPDPPSEK
ncbi:atg16-protein [Fusarium langsethiae]|uniref:Atg16-protein n=1 Tax=Fusarium langsethiae TaxID=179993 RepID=A0A0N0DC07_FUSLA|nr:atg16-protein [Fusarium langsethiae]GKU06036.1 unnamed protein product [Fusarium langsethiae]GKU22423.1 unnamed protein product [Fusarium langsethiae]